MSARFPSIVKFRVPVKMKKELDRCARERSRNGRVVSSSEIVRELVARMIRSHQKKKTAPE
jgi:Arc/MetJ-type ribon-helix-helix transcriptional regulator